MLPCAECASPPNSAGKALPPLFNWSPGELDALSPAAQVQSKIGTLTLVFCAVDATCYNAAKAGSNPQTPWALCQPGAS
jgi:hypothetical protein